MTRVLALTHEPRHVNILQTPGADSGKWRPVTPSRGRLKLSLTRRHPRRIGSGGTGGGRPVLPLCADRVDHHLRQSLTREAAASLIERVNDDRTEGRQVHALNPPHLSIEEPHV